MTRNAGYIRRLLARSIDLLLIYTLLMITGYSAEQNPAFFLWAFLLYNAITILLSGSTLGRYVTQISVRSSSTGLQRTWLLLIREITLIVLSPLVFVTLLMLSDTLYHDRVCKTQVVYNAKEK